MSKTKRISMVVLAVVGWAILMATPVFAKSYSWKETGTSLWIFVMIGSMIIFLQLLPATILFFTFIGTTSTLVFKGKKGSKKEEKKLPLPGYEAERLEE